MKRGYFSNASTYSVGYTLPYWFMKSVRKVFVGTLTPVAEKRLAMIEFYHQVKDATVICRMFKIFRKTFYKWLTRYNRNDLTTLEDRSRTPHSRRKTTLTFENELKIKRLREEYIRLGKKKLQILYRKKHKEYISQHHVSYVTQKYNLYCDPQKAKKLRTKKKHWGAKKKIRVNEINPRDYLTQDKPFFFATDTVVLYLPYGIKRYIVTAIEQEKKIAYARVYKNKSSLSAFDFLMRLSMLVDGKIAVILSDNGSEFAKCFEEACRRLKIIHIFTRVKTPKDNPVDERFNRTVQEEFMETSEYFEPSLTNDDLTEANKLLTEWLLFYNFERPHQTLKYKTPIEWYNSYKLNGVLPMYPSITTS